MRYKVTVMAHGFFPMSDGPLESQVAQMLTRLTWELPIWPNPWSQDLAGVAFLINAMQQVSSEQSARIAELEAENEQLKVDAAISNGRHLAERLAFADTAGGRLTAQVEILRKQVEALRAALIEACGIANDYADGRERHDERIAELRGLATKLF